MSKELTILIPARLKNVAKNGHVAGTEDIYDDELQKTQKEINAERKNDIINLDNEVSALQKQDIEVVADHTAVTNPDPKKIYREQGTESYTDYMYQNNAWKELATYSFPGIDDVPTAGSDNLVKSGGVYSKIFFINVNGVNNNNTTAYTLETAIAAVPEVLRKPYAYIAYRMEGQKFGFAQFKGSVVGNNYVYWLDTSYWQDNLTEIESKLLTLNNLTNNLEIKTAPFGEFTIPTSTITTGEYITKNGALAESSAYNKASIILKRGEYLTCKLSASTSVAAIAVKNGNNYIIKEVGKKDDTVLEYYSIVAAEPIEVVLSYRNSSELQPVILKSTVVDITNYATLDLCKKITDGNIDKQHYISNTGKYLSNNNFAIITLSLTEGDYLFIETEASSNIAVVSEIDGEIYNPVILGSDGTKILPYRYYATKNIQIAVCGRYTNNGDHSIDIYKKPLACLLNINKEELDYVSQNHPAYISPLFINKDISSINIITGSYITYQGQVQSGVSSYSMTDVIALNVGETLVLKCSAGDGCSVISEYDEDLDSYKVVYRGTGAMHFYNYIAIRDTKLVLSFRNTEQYLIKISEVTTYSKEFLKSEANKYVEFLKFFERAICIGDSVTAGAVSDYPRTTGAVAVDIPKFSYPRQLEKMTGVVVENAGFDGYSPKQWYDEKINNYTYSNYNLALIELGYNGGMSDTFDTDVAPYQDYHDYADTPCGNYCKIIGAIKESNPNIMIVLLISPYINIVHEGNYAATAVVIKKAAKFFELPYIDLRPNIIEDLNDYKFHGKVSGGNRDMIHFNPVGYMAKANLVKALLAKIVYDNLAALNNSVPIPSE